MLVKAKIFSMDFWIQRPFTHENIKVERYGTFEKYKKTRDYIKGKRMHAQTGVLTIKVPAEMEDRAEEYAKPLTDDLWMLLSFAHGHDVPIQGFWFFDEKDGKEIPRGYSISGMRVGKPGGGSCWNLQYGVDKFIQQTMPLLENEAFVTRTNIRHVIGWYNEAQNTNLVEYKFMSLWMGLEGMANVYDRINPGAPILTVAEWTRMRAVLHDFLVDLDKEEFASNLLQRFQFLRDRHISDKISRLLAEYGLDQYSNEVRSLNQMRNDILHGHRLHIRSKPSPFDLEHRLKRLTEKLILKALDFYDNNMIYHSIKNENLDSR